MPESQTKIALQLSKLHAAQQKVVDEAKRFNVLCCGRQWGKTKLLQNLVILPALGGFPTGWYSPTYKSLDESWEEMVDRLSPITKKKNEQQKKIAIEGGGRIEFWSLEDPDASRGRKYKQIVVDEAALIKNLKDVWQKTLRATLLRFQGSAWLASTPRGIQNDFKLFYDYGQDPTRPSWGSWQMPTNSNPFITQSEIDDMQMDLTELAFAQECLAQFVSWEGAVFKRINEALGRKLAILNQTIIAVDWAGVGQRGDFTVFMAIDLGGTVMEIKRFRGKTYGEQRDDLKRFIDKWSPSLVKVVGEENNMGGPQIEKLRVDGVAIESWVTTYGSKQLVVEGLALMFEREQIAIADGIENAMVLVGELQAFEPKRTATGLTTYAASSGHDDTVMALVIGAQYIAKERAGGLGWIEFLKQMQARMDNGEVEITKSGLVVPKDMAKPVTSDDTPRCAECGSVCIQPLKTQAKRCGNCGHIWNEGPAGVFSKGQSRAEYQNANRS